MIFVEPVHDMKSRSSMRFRDLRGIIHNYCCGSKEKECSDEYAIHEVSRITKIISTIDAFRRDNVTKMAVRREVMTMEVDRVMVLLWR